MTGAPLNSIRLSPDSTLSDRQHPRIRHRHMEPELRWYMKK
jgi:hypothetical protein